MLKRTYEDQNCSIARALELVGERWTLLIVRDALLGLRRFDEFQQSLGIARNILSGRLNRLVSEGILERVRYQARPERFEYQLTTMGRELAVPVLALMQWGDRHLSEKPPRLARRRSDHSRLRAVLVADDGTIARPRDVEVISGPGARSRTAATNTSGSGRSRR